MSPSIHAKMRYPKPKKKYFRPFGLPSPKSPWLGFVSERIHFNWKAAQLSFQSTSNQIQNWDHRLITLLITLYKSPWDDCNKHLHGTTWEEAKSKQHQRVIGDVQQIYSYPPRLHPRYPKVMTMPFTIQIRYNNGINNSFCPIGCQQLPLHWAFSNTRLLCSNHNKYPPWISKFPRIILQKWNNIFTI